MRVLFDFISLCLLGLGLIGFVLSLVPAAQRRFRRVFTFTLWVIGLGIAVFIVGLLSFHPPQPLPPPPPSPQEGNPNV